MHIMIIMNYEQMIVVGFFTLFDYLWVTVCNKNGFKRNCVGLLSCQKKVSRSFQDFDLEILFNIPYIKLLI